MNYDADGLRGALTALAGRSTSLDMSAEVLLRHHQRDRVRRRATAVAAVTVVGTGGAAGAVRAFETAATPTPIVVGAGSPGATAGVPACEPTFYSRPTPAVPSQVPPGTTTFTWLPDRRLAIPLPQEPAPTRTSRPSATQRTPASAVTSPSAAVQSVGAPIPSYSASVLPSTDLSPQKPSQGVVSALVSSAPLGVRETCVESDIVEFGVGDSEMAVTAFVSPDYGASAAATLITELGSPDAGAPAGTQQRTLPDGDTVIFVASARDHAYDQGVADPSYEAAELITASAYIVLEAAVPAGGSSVEPVAALVSWEFRADEAMRRS